MKTYSPYQFAFFRIILGFYLCYHFISLIPYAGEIWSVTGVLPDPYSNFTYGIIPNIFQLLTSPLEVTLFISALGLLSLFLLIGFQRNIVSLLLWFGWICLFDRNNLINNPGIPFIGWILLCCAVIPKGEALAVGHKIRQKWQFPVLLYWGAWALMAAGYLLSGIDKLSAPSWQDGSAIIHLLENPLAHDYWIRTKMLQLPVPVLNLLTWFILFLELSFLPLVLWSKTRKWAWLSMVLMHLGILLIIDFADLTFGMLMIHWLTFDSRWLIPAHPRSSLVFFDSDCLMCNRFIQFLLKIDLADTLTFAPLNGKSAQSNNIDQQLINSDTIVMTTSSKIYI